MARATVYVIPGSHPALAVRGMLEHKGIDYRRIDLIPVVSRGVLKALRFPGVTPSWDNMARRRTGGGFILKGSTPDLYGQWLGQVIRRRLDRPPDERLVFINAWNEWAEGNYLEPGDRWGHGYLRATRDALAGPGGAGP